MNVKAEAKLVYGFKIPEWLPEEWWAAHSEKFTDWDGVVDYFYRGHLKHRVEIVEWGDTCKEYILAAKRLTLEAHDGILKMYPTFDVPTQGEIVVLSDMKKFFGVPQDEETGWWLVSNIE